MGGTLLDYGVVVNMLFALFARSHFGYELGSSQKTKGAVPTHTTPCDVGRDYFLFLMPQVFIPNIA